MQASTEFAKAIHICIYINFIGKELVSSTELAESVKTNPVVVRRLVTKLKQHGVLDSLAGSKGGFFLKKKPESTSLWDIYMAVRAEDFFNRPKVNPDCVVSSNLKILVHDIFSEAELNMKDKLDGVSIHMLTGKLKRLINDEKYKGFTGSEEVKIF